MYTLLWISWKQAMVNMPWGASLLNFYCARRSLIIMTRQTVSQCSRESSNGLLVHLNNVKQVRWLIQKEARQAFSGFKFKDLLTRYTPTQIPACRNSHLLHLIKYAMIAVTGLCYIPGIPNSKSKFSTAVQLSQ